MPGNETDEDDEDEEEGVGDEEFERLFTKDFACSSSFLSGF